MITISRKTKRLNTNNNNKKKKSQLDKWIDQKILLIKKGKTKTNFNSFQSKHDALITWLGTKCERSIDALQDPGYSGSYKSHFNIRDEDLSFYKQGDLDDLLNIGYVGYSDNSTKMNYELQSSFNQLPKDIQNNHQHKHRHDEMLEHFMDYVPIYPETDETDKTENMVKDEEEEIHHIIIPPGSNQSNANYLYKRLVLLANENEPYSVPFVSKDLNKPFKGIYKGVNIEIDKDEFYQFLKDNSL